MSPIAETATTVTREACRPLVSLSKVTKRYPGVIANDSVDLDIYPGEVHVLLGENGAGKSTLIGMMSGLQEPDEGSISVDGIAVGIESPRKAINLGIGTVFQHSMLVPTLSVAENLLLGEPWWSRPARAELARRVHDVAESLGIELNPDAIAAELSLGEQQQVEIVRALLRNSRVLILDESTSMLTPKGVEELGVLMRRLVERGMAIVFISHKLNEAAAFGDRISVLKLGRVAGRIDPIRFKSLSAEKLISEIVDLMFGDAATSSADQAHRISRSAPSDEVMLEVDGLRMNATGTTPGLNKIQFSVRAGEILGIAGIDGNGQKQLAEALAGQNEATAKVLNLQGVSMCKMSIAERRKQGLRFLTDDRLGEGTVGSFPVSTNLFLKEIGDRPMWVSGFDNVGAQARKAKQIVADFDVRTPGIQTPVGRLSGGNIQKVLLGRELAQGSRVVIFNKPTYGLDLTNISAIRARIVDIAERGMAVVLISTELDELLSLSDRIAVMSQGTMTGIVDNGPDARNQVGRLMIGINA